MVKSYGVGNFDDIPTPSCVTGVNFFQRIDDGHCDRLHAYLSAGQCFNDGNVGKQPVAWEEYCMSTGNNTQGLDRCPCQQDRTEK